MLKKLGKKLKKGLKKAAPIIALAGAAALAGRKGRAAKQLTPKYFGGGLDSSGAPRTDFISGDASTAENIANFDRGMTRIADAGGVANLKKGGRVGVGIAKRGFGRAMKGKK